MPASSAWWADDDIRATNVLPAGAAGAAGARVLFEPQPSERVRVGTRQSTVPHDEPNEWLDPVEFVAEAYPPGRDTASEVVRIATPATPWSDDPRERQSTSNAFHTPPPMPAHFASGHSANSLSPISNEEPRRRMKVAGRPSVTWTVALVAAGAALGCVAFEVLQARSAASSARPAAVVVNAPVAPVAAPAFVAPVDVGSVVNAPNAPNARAAAPTPSINVVQFKDTDAVLVVPAVGASATAATSAPGTSESSATSRPARKKSKASTPNGGSDAKGALLLPDPEPSPYRTKP